MIILGFLLALFIGTFVEYILHRAMHSWFFPARHWEHHKDNHAHYWVWDFFFYYTPMSLPLMPLGLLGGLEFFVGWVIGAVLYSFLLSFCHMIQHHYPKKVFWMRYPIHYYHHHFNKGTDNFGVVTCWWDHLLGTYYVPVQNRRMP